MIMYKCLSRSLKYTKFDENCVKSKTWLYCTSVSLNYRYLAKALYFKINTYFARACVCTNVIALHVFDVHAFFPKHFHDQQLMW